MSWDQGVQVREDLPPRFVAWADQQKGGAKLEYITWFEGDYETVYLDYGEAGSLTMKLNPRKAPEKRP
jgi:hypothetical protein